MHNHVLVTGGAGYVGARLIPRLLEGGYQVTVLDWMLYKCDVFEKMNLDTAKLRVIKGDLRDKETVETALHDVDAVIHLACISNDPSFDLNPDLGRTINLDSFRPLVELSLRNKVKRFIYASSSSVYGVKDTSNVHEEMLLEPLTDYSKYKAECEKILAEYNSNDWTSVTIRPATVCGYSPRQRLDVIVNILTNHAVNNRKILVFGGDQLRPNLHIDDMVDAYLLLLETESSKVHGKIFNAGGENKKVSEIAETVKSVVGDDVKLIFEKSDDPRSYHISSEKIKNQLGFIPKKSIKDAVFELKCAFEQGYLPNSFSDKTYYNIKTMLDANIR